MTRAFDPTRSIAPELLDEILDLSRRAPSAGFSQGTVFLVLEGVARESFWTTTGADEWFGHKAPGVLDAPTIVIPLADQRAYVRRYSEPDKAGHGLEAERAWPVPYWLTDTAMATQQLLLLAEDRGLGALFFGIFRNEAALMAELGVPPEVRPIGAVAVGYRAEDDRPSGTGAKRERRSAEQVVMHGRWTDPTG
jgi:nitroreductase